MASPRPIQAYPLIENALRAAQGMTLAEHARRLGEMMSDFTTVAAANPYAWFPVERSAEELTTPTAENRMIGFPYTKYLNAVISTDQAGAYVMTSVGKARELGIPEDRWVYWWGGHHAAEEAWHVSTRPNFAECPSMKDSSVGGARPSRRGHRRHRPVRLLLLLPHRRADGLRHARHRRTRPPDRSPSPAASPTAAAPARPTP